MGVLTGAANLFFLYKFIRILTTPWKESEAYKLGIIDENGKILKKSSRLKGSEEKDAYTMMHRFTWKLKRLLEKIPFGKSRIASYAAALWFIKEHKNFDDDSNEELMQESFLSFLETDWKDDALILKENFEGDMDKQTFSNLREAKRGKLPPHLAKFFDKKGNLKKDAADRVKKGRAERGVKITDRTPDWMFKEKAPPGWENTVKKMKKHKEIDNPYALAWYMANKGDKPADWEKHTTGEEVKDMAGEWGTNKLTNTLKNETPGQELKEHKGTKPHKHPHEDEVDEGHDKTVCPKCDGEGCDHCDGKGYHAEAKEREISHKEYLKYGAGRDGKQWTTGKGKNTRYWTHRKEEVESEDEAYGGTKKRLKSKKMLKFKGYIHKKDKSAGYVEEVEIDEEVFNWYIIKGTAEKGKVAHVGTERQLKLKIRKPTFPDGHVLLKSRKHLKVGDKWKGSMGVSEEVEIDEKVKPAKDVGLECMECGKKFRHKNPIYGKTKCPKCKSTDLDLAFGEEVNESTKEYAKSLEKIANDRALKMLTKSERQNLKKIAALLSKERKEEVEEGWKKGKYTIKDKNGKILGTYSSGGKAQRAMDDLMQKGDYDKLEVSIVEEVELDEASKSAIQSFGKKLSDYAKKSGGIDKDDLGFIGKEAMGGELPNPKSLSRMDTEPREVVIDLMGKEFGRKFVEREYKVKFTNPKNYKESSILKFDHYLKEGRPALSPDYVPGITMTDRERTRLVDAQHKRYTLNDIKSLARKHKVKLSSKEEPLKFDTEWTIVTRKGETLIYDERTNGTRLTGWKVNKDKLRAYKDRYEQEHTRMQDVLPMGGKIDLRGFESAFELIGEEVLSEELPANSTGSAVVGTGDDPTVWKKKKERKNAKVKTEEFGGKKVFIVSPEKFWNARMGKSRYTRYEKYVGNDKLGEAIRQFGRENPKAPIILKNSENGAMLYLKYGGRI